jgi:hypothetical protein
LIADQLEAPRHLATIDTALAAPSAGGERVRHVKRGTEYDVLFRGVELQVATPEAMNLNGTDFRLVALEGQKLVVYRGAEGKLWARKEAEFDDGRFAALAAPSEGGGDE